MDFCEDLCGEPVQEGSSRGSLGGSPLRRTRSCHCVSFRQVSRDHKQGTIDKTAIEQSQSTFALNLLCLVDISWDPSSRCNKRKRSVIVREIAADINNGEVQSSSLARSRKDAERRGKEGPRTGGSGVEEDSGGGEETEGGGRGGAEAAQEGAGGAETATSKEHGEREKATG